MNMNLMIFMTLIPFTMIIGGWLLMRFKPNIYDEAEKFYHFPEEK
jgi:hypothetical protein